MRLIRVLRKSGKGCCRLDNIGALINNYLYYFTILGVPLKGSLKGSIRVTILDDGMVGVVELGDPQEEDSQG